MATHTHARVLGLAAALCFSACALPVSSGTESPISAIVKVPIQVNNESSDIVYLYLVPDHGLPIRVGTVTPYETTSFVARLGRNLTGSFYARRLSEDVRTPLKGPEVVAMGLENHTAVIHIGPTSTFDDWRIGR